MARKGTLLCSVGFLILTATAHGQTAEASISFGAAGYSGSDLGRSLPSSSVFFDLDGGFRLTARFTINTRRFVGHEIGYGYTHGKLSYSDDSASGTSTSHSFLYNFLLYAIPEGKRVRPFVTGGGQLVSYLPPGAAVGTGVTKVGYNYGGGVKIRLWDLFALRLDYRNSATGKPNFGFNEFGLNGLLRQNEFTAGFGVYF